MLKGSFSFLSRRNLSESLMKRKRCVCMASRRYLFPLICGFLPVIPRSASPSIHLLFRPINQPCVCVCVSGESRKRWKRKKRKPHSIVVSWKVKSKKDIFKIKQPSRVVHVSFWSTMTTRTFHTCASDFRFFLLFFNIESLRPTGSNLRDLYFLLFCVFILLLWVST